MVNQTLAGWILVVIALVLLLAFGNLALLAILVPVSIVVGYGIARLGENRGRLTPGLKKG
ncbi:MAG: hypothetical protein LAN83_03045 [Acidobacteriia bacterium]|nr:hypothetical protein [Terriglobia bacterium]